MTILSVTAVVAAIPIASVAREMRLK